MNRLGLISSVILATVLATVLPIAAVSAQVQQADTDLSPAHSYFTDLVLTNQHGQPMRLYSDLLHGRTVVISAFFASCTGVCPVIHGKMRELQEWLGDRLGSEVYLISLSVDPETDTPEALAEYAHHLGAEEGWYFLTGDTDQVRLALSKLGMSVTSREQHTNVLYLGREPQSRWAKVSGMDPELLRQVDQFLRQE